MPDDEATLPLDELIRAVEAEDQSAVHALAEEMHYADLAQAYQEIDEEKRELFLKTVGPEKAADMIVELPDTMIEEALDAFSPSELKVLFRELSDDDRVDILQDVGDEARLRFLGLLGPEDEELTRSLLKYEHDTAGGRMTTRIGRVFVHQTVKQAIEMLRRGQESTETLSRIFVVDGKGRLIGKLRFRDLAFNTWDTPVRDIMREIGPERVLATADQEEAANMLLKYDLIALPVVDEFEHLLGIVTHDDAMEILQEESTEDIEKIAGIGGEQSEETYLNTSIVSQFRRRAGWLTGLAFVSLLSGYVMMRFGNVLSQVFLLSLFLPMVVAAGGNTGGQASTMVIRAMSLGEIGPGTTWWDVAWKELRTGFFLGLLLGLCMALFTLLLLPFFHLPMPVGMSLGKVAFAVAMALTTQVTSATFLGSLLPLGARAAKLDPAVVSAPAIAAIVDVSGMVIYFTVARAILGL